MSCILASCNKGSENAGRSSAKTYNLEGQQWKSKVRTHFSNDIYYRASEVPNAYYLLKQKDVLGKSFDSIMKASEKERIIEFEFEHFNEYDLLTEEFTALDYDKAVEYMAFKIEKDFKVITSANDTIPCAGVHFERHFKISPFKRVLLYFNGIDPDETIQLIYQDQLFNNGIFKFKFEETPLKM